MLLISLLSMVDPTTVLPSVALAAAAWSRCAWMIPSPMKVQVLKSSAATAQILGQGRSSRILPPCCQVHHVEVWR